MSGITPIRFSVEELKQLHEVMERGATSLKSSIAAIESSNKKGVSLLPPPLSETELAELTNWIEQFGLRLGGAVPPPIPETKPARNRTLQIGIIVGCVLGGFLLVSLGLIVVNRFAQEVVARAKAQLKYGETVTVVPKDGSSWLIGKTVGALLRARKAIEDDDDAVDRMLDSDRVHIVTHPTIATYEGSIGRFIHIKATLVDYDGRQFKYVGYVFADEVAVERGTPEAIATVNSAITKKSEEAAKKAATP